MEITTLTEEEKQWIQKQKQISDLIKQVGDVKAQATADKKVKNQEIHAIDVKLNSDVAELENQITTIGGE